MRELRGLTALLLMLFAAGCYSHTKGVVYEHGPGPTCKHAWDWVPEGPGGPGYWRC
jgi:hypothetical protein